MVRFLDRLFALASVGWFAVLALDPNAVERDVFFFGTVGVVTVNFLLCVAVYLVTRKSLVLVLLSQFLLFGLLHHQVYQIDPKLYVTDRPPGFTDWAWLLGAHALRAADLLDVIETYDLKIQRVKHAGWEAGTFLVYMHLVVDVFLIGLVVAWFQKKPTEPGSYEEIVQKEKAEARTGKLRSARPYVLAALFIVMGGFAVQNKWAGNDWWQWPLGNALKLLDVCDMIQIYGWKVHGVQEDMATKTFGVVFRLVVGIFIVKHLLPFARGCLTFLVIVFIGFGLYYWSTHRDEFRKDLERDRDADKKSSLVASPFGSRGA